MLNKTQLSTMLNLQDSMNLKVNPEWITAGYAYLRAAMIEAVEGIEHHGWKWWKHQQKDLPQLQMELVDIWHFALSHILIEHAGDVDKCAELIRDELSGNSGRIEFDKKAYTFTQADLVDNLQLMTGLCAAGRFDVPLFMHIIEQAEMSTDELYRQYVGKNVLNFFRQDNGYKEGSYLKIWHGEEDNEHLVRIMDELNIEDQNFANLVYDGLAKRYPAS